MDRQIVYVGQIPLDTDELNTNKNIYISHAKLAGAVLGTTQILNGFNCTATSPPGMTVNVGLGEVYSLQNVDNSSYGSLNPDTADQIVKQGIVMGTTNLSCPAPLTSGYSINYLVEVGFLEQDTNSTVLPYYNSSNINAPYSGPNNTGAAQNTTRQNTATVTVKTGVAAPTGTQTTPNPDSGFTGAWVVTVANGQTSITGANISVYSSASFINETLTQKISQPTADLRYTQITRVQNGYYWAATDTGSANAYVGSLSPAITSYTTGQIVFMVIAHTNTGASTINLNSVGVKNIKLTNGSDPLAGDIVAGMIACLVYDGTEFQLINPVSRISAGQIQSGSLLYSADTGTANAYVATLSPAPGSYAAGMKLSLLVAHTNTTSSTINVNSLGLKNIKLTNGSNLNPGDMVANQIADLEYDGTQFQLLNPATWASQLQVQNGSLIYAADTGSANAYAAALSPAPSAYTTGMVVNVKIANTNTGASTFNLNSLGAKNIIHSNGNALAAGDLVAGQIACFGYDGTNIQLLNSPAQVTAAQVQSGTLIYAVSTSSPNTYTATLSPALASYTAGMKVRIKFSNTNTGAATLNLNSLGAINIKREDGSSLVSGDIKSNIPIDLIYDGTNWILPGTKIWQFSAQLSANGYQILPTGLILQWGTATIPQNGQQRSTVAVTFPTAFPNNLFGISTQFSGIINNTALISTQAISQTTSGFTVQADTPGIFTTGPYLCFWHAFGN